MPYEYRYDGEEWKLLADSPKASEFLEEYGATSVRADTQYGLLEIRWMG